MPYMIEHPNCDGSGPHTGGQVRVMPTGGGGNLILCLSCWQRENLYRAERNHHLSESAKFDLIPWKSGEVYEVGK